MVGDDALAPSLTSLGSLRSASVLGLHDELLSSLLLT